MIPARFSYEAPSTLKAALGALEPAMTPRLSRAAKASTYVDMRLPQSTHPVAEQ
jgi:hypothetical protein